MSTTQTLLLKNTDFNISANDRADSLDKTLPPWCTPLSEQMRLLGSTALEEEGAGDDDRTAVPMDFLMEIMEIRESIERCATAEDAEAILSETKAAADACLRSMDEALRAGGGKEELSDAAVRLRYLYRIEDEALRVMHRLEDGHGNPSAA